MTRGAFYAEKPQWSDEIISCHGDCGGSAPVRGTGGVWRGHRVSGGLSARRPVSRFQYKRAFHAVFLLSVQRFNQ